MRVTIRPATPDDYGFIVHSGIKELKGHHLSAKDIERLDYVFKPVVDAVVRGASAVAVACDAEDPDTLVGWAVANQGRTIFVYVSASLRGHGIDQRLESFVTPGETSCEN